MARAMTNIISEVRSLIQDTTSPYTLADAAVTAMLDRWGQRIMRHKLSPLAPDLLTGEVTWFSASATHWENQGSLALKDADGVAHTPTESDLIRGYWKVPPTDEDIWLYDGYTYDIYAAASECCHVLIALLREEYSFSTSEGTFNREQRIATLQDLADRYARSKRMWHLPTGGD